MARTSNKRAMTAGTLLIFFSQRLITGRKVADKIRTIKNNTSMSLIKKRR